MTAMTYDTPDGNTWDQEYWKHPWQSASLGFGEVMTQQHATCHAQTLTGRHSQQPVSRQQSLAIGLQEHKNALKRWPFWMIVESIESKEGRNKWKRDDRDVDMEIVNHPAVVWYCTILRGKADVGYEFQGTIFFSAYARLYTPLWRPDAFGVRFFCGGVRFFSAYAHGLKASGDHEFWERMPLREWQFAFVSKHVS